ncbi:hypothetical protein [Brucella intermedia]|uniref:hypothetical protein n=1 Tax=Brucella intermedia TaxID=94625 RepID=UPI00235F8F43|nr:hypothetical protein [Brucella intermedia]
MLTVIQISPTPPINDPDSQGVREIFDHLAMQIEKGEKNIQNDIARAQPNSSISTLPPEVRKRLDRMVGPGQSLLHDAIEATALKLYREREMYIKKSTLTKAHNFNTVLAMKAIKTVITDIQSLLST